VTRLIRFFVDNYVLTFSVFGALMLFGALTLFGLGVDLMPPVEVPVVAVSTTYPGAGPEEVSRQVGERIEGALTTLPGVTSVSSVAMENVSFVIAQFSADVSVDQAAIDVSQRVNAIVGQLPDDAGRPSVQKFDPNDEPILNVALIAPGRDLVEVQSYAEDDLRPALLRVNGVADVSVVGPAKREVQVILDPARLSSYGLSPQAVAGAIAAASVDVPAGNVIVGDQRVLLAGRSTPSSLREVEEIRVDPSRGVRVADVAVVRDGSSDVTSYTRIDGEPAVLLEVRKVSGSNSVNTARGVRETLRDVALPASYSAVIVGDTTEFVEHTVNDTLVEMAIAALAVSLIVLVFVGRLGTVFAVVLAIPVSLAGTLAIFAVLGFTLNIVTLLAITVAIGLVVDDAIVVAENIDRYREQGLPLKEAVLKGAGSVSTAVLAATLSLEAVFLPISFLPGIVGEFFSQFGITLAAAIAFSYLEAMFFLTVRLALSPDPLPPSWQDLAASTRRARSDVSWLLRSARKPVTWVLLVAAAALLWYYLAPAYALLVLAAPLAAFLLRYLGRLVLLFLGAVSRSLYQVGEAATAWVRDRYVGSLAAALKRPWIVLGAAGALFASVFVIFPTIGFNFVPRMDSGQLVATVTLPAGTSLERTNQAATVVEDYLRRHEATALVQVQVGSGALLGEANAGTASFIVELVDRHERDVTTDDLALQLRDELAALLAPYQGAKVSVGNASETFVAGTSTALTIVLSSNDMALLRERAERAVEVLSDMPGLLDVESDLAEVTNERVFVIDPARLDGTGLTVADVYSALRAYNVPTEAARLREGGTDLPVVVSTDPRSVATEQQLLSLPVMAPALRSELPLGSLGAFETRQAPGSISRAQQEYSAQISADLGPGQSLSVVEERARERLLAAGVLDDVVREQTEGTLDLLDDLITYGPIAFGLALLLNYLAIASQFNSFRYPLYLLLTVPLALVGAVWLFFITGTTLDVISVLGVVMLVGLVTKNAILLLDHALARVREGADLRSALLEAAGVRFRPIVMTTVTVIVISVPLLLGLGEGSELRYPLGLVILGGVTTSALLTFYVVPAAFWLFERRAIEGRRASETAAAVPA
jgi:HAE1 family hydrophobic/amphiphilic exporter-1